MTQVLDYSAGHPGALAIAKPTVAPGQQAYIGAVRYIGFPDRGKCTTRAELEDFSRNGLGMALVYEDTAGDWRKGYTQGVAAGRRARDHANTIGFPAGRPIYMAIDQDVVTEAEYASMLDYLRGASVSLGGARLTGVYGEADVIDRTRAAGVATWYWQTIAWSHARRTTAHLFQRIGTVSVGGVGCDINDVLADDWGQHNHPATILEDDVALADPIEIFAPGDRKWAETHPATQILGDTYYWAADTYRAVTGVILPALATLAAAAAGGQVDQAAVLAHLDTSVREATTQAINGTVLPALQAVLTEVLGADNASQADAIVTALAARLRPAAA